MRDSRYDNNFLYFEEGPHKYTDSDGNEYKSVTTLIHDNYIPHFDKKFWLHKKAKELGISEKQLEHIAIQNYGCSKQDWIDKIYSKIQEALKGNVK